MLRPARQFARHFLLRQLSARTLALIVGLIFATLSHAQKYDTHDGCDAARWSEWESIIIGFEGDAVEQDDARSVRDFKRALCKRMADGELSQEKADEMYDAEVEAWGTRIKRRQRARTRPRDSDSMG